MHPGTSRNNKMDLKKAFWLSGAMPLPWGQAAWHSWMHPWDLVLRLCACWPVLSYKWVDVRRACITEAPASDSTGTHAGHFAPLNLVILMESWNCSEGGEQILCPASACDEHDYFARVLSSVWLATPALDCLFAFHTPPAESGHLQPLLQDVSVQSHGRDLFLKCRYHVPHTPWKVRWSSCEIIDDVCTHPLTHT